MHPRSAQTMSELLRPSELLRAPAEHQAGRLSAEDFAYLKAHVEGARAAGPRRYV
jgi:hypothetical protein